MQNVSNTCPELDIEYREEGSGVIDCLYRMESEISELKKRLEQIKSISELSRLGLEATVECYCCAIEGVLRAIENIAGNK